MREVVRIAPHQPGPVPGARQWLDACGAYNTNNAVPGRLSANTNHL